MLIKQSNSYPEFAEEKDQEPAQQKNASKIIAANSGSKPRNILFSLFEYLSLCEFTELAILFMHIYSVTISSSIALN